MKRVIANFFGILIVIGLIAAPSVIDRIHRYRLISEQESINRPPVQQLSHRISSSSSLSSFSSSSSSFSSINWPVPFTPQAPAGNWDPPFHEACEEASALMVLRYFADRTIDSTEDAEAAIQNLVASNQRLGFPVDDTAEQLAQLLQSQDPSLSVELLHDPTVDQIKQSLINGELIIVPAAGRMLKNPYYKRPGPLYHMLVLRGFTADGYVITNDPGTKRGEEYVYRWETLLKANHDWNGGDVEHGQRVMIIVGEGETQRN